MILWNRILVGVDESEPSLHALRYLAGVLGGSNSSKVRLLAVYTPPDADNIPDPAALTDEAAERRLALENRLAEAYLILVGSAPGSREPLHGAGGGRWPHRGPDHHGVPGPGRLRHGRGGAPPPEQGRGVPFWLGEQLSGAPGHGLLRLGRGLSASGQPCPPAIPARKHPLPVEPAMDELSQRRQDLQRRLRQLASQPGVRALPPASTAEALGLDFHRLFE